jgi:hypothetical protein
MEGWYTSVVKEFQKSEKVLPEKILLRTVEPPKDLALKVIDTGYRDGRASICKSDSVISGFIKKANDHVRIAGPGWMC